MFTIYQIRCIPTSLLYIGITSLDVKDRWRRHLSSALISHRNAAFQKAICLYGRDSFCITILETHSDKKIAIGRERELIKQMNTLYPNGYNSTNGGELLVGWKHTQATKDKISKSRMGIKPNAETRKRLSSHQIGKRLSAEHKAKISASNKGKKVTAETIEKIRKTKTGTKYTSEHCRAISEGLQKNFLAS